jgi:hypothetical protein
MMISSTPTTRDTATREAPRVADTSRRSIARSVPTRGGVVKGPPADSLEPALAVTAVGDYDRSSMVGALANGKLSAIIRPFAIVAPNAR